jgi:hypothetical protein
MCLQRSMVSRKISRTAESSKRLGGQLWYMSTLVSTSAGFIPVFVLFPSVNWCDVPFLLPVQFSCISFFFNPQTVSTPGLFHKLCLQLI